MYAVRGVAWRGVARRRVNRDIDRYLGTCPLVLLYSIH